MTIESLLEGASVIRTYIERYNHTLPITIKRKTTYIAANLEYEHSHSKPELDFLPLQNNEGYSVVNAVIAVEPISPDYTEHQLFEAFKNLGLKIDEYLDQHESEMLKAKKHEYISFSSIDCHEPDFELKCHDHLFSRENLRAFFKAAGTSNLALTQSYARKNIDADPRVYYFQLDEDAPNIALKITLTDEDFELGQSENIVENLELVRIHPKRDEVLRSAKEYLLEEFNQDFECEPDPETYKILYDRIKAKYVA